MGLCSSTLRSTRTYKVCNNFSFSNTFYEFIKVLKIYGSVSNSIVDVYLYVKVLSVIQHLKHCLHDWKVLLYHVVLINKVLQNWKRNWKTLASGVNMMLQGDKIIQVVLNTQQWNTNRPRQHTHPRRHHEATIWYCELWEILYVQALEYQEVSLPTCHLERGGIWTLCISTKSKTHGFVSAASLSTKIILFAWKLIRYDCGCFVAIHI